MEKFLQYIIGLGFLGLFSVACQSDTTQVKKATVNESAPMLELLTKEQTGVRFDNRIEETPNFNYFYWDAFYNGSGVSTGDINNDGLADIYFGSSVGGDKLYLNKGNMEFEDISKDAGIARHKGWTFGSTMADVNGDGFLDIYVCRTGMTLETKERENLLFINQGDNTFKEEAKKWGVADPGISTQATFFDYDKDGDLDLFVLNEPLYKKTKNIYKTTPDENDPLYSNHLYRCDGDKFTDVTDQAGLKSHTFSLNVVAKDINNDGWVDLFVSNDFDDPEKMYYNNGDGTFTDKAKEQLKHTSFYSMGSDIADINNDTYYDIGTLDMAGATHYRSKTNMGSMNISQFWEYVNEGKNYQYMYNTLQLNNGKGSFSDISQIAHMASTDWSWSLLFADIDNDTNEDILITNGIKRDVRNNDVFTQFKANIDSGNRKMDPMAILNTMPSTPLSNYIYHNKGGLHFENVADDWGFGQKGFSQGMAIADLDNDGDLDVVISNMQTPSAIYRNNKGGKNNFLRVQFKGKDKNTLALNTKVLIEYGDQKQLKELTMTRGYFSSSEPVLHFGLGQTAVIEKMTVTWPDGKSTVMENVDANQLMTLDWNAATGNAAAVATTEGRIKEVTASKNVGFTHVENEVDEFAREILLPHRQSMNGPYVSVGDVNGDGNEDFFVGGAAGQSGELYLAKGNAFEKAAAQPWAKQSHQEDMGSVFFDADGDKDLDLYIVRGGAMKDGTDAIYQDGLYLNDGQGNFSPKNGAIPAIKSSGQRVKAADYDADGDMDLFVGGRIVPGSYPAAAQSYLLENNGGVFKDVTKTVAPELATIGLVTDAVFADTDGDKDLDLVVVGEWMPITVFTNDNGQFTNTSDKAMTAGLKGWWWSIAAEDFDKDGDVDFMVGNIGLNNKFKASAKKPFVILGNDFDNNGTNDVVLAKFNGDKLQPTRGRECSSEQMPFIAEKFPTFDGFAKAEIGNIYNEEQLSSAVQYEVSTFKSTFLKNNGAGIFTNTDLPLEVQTAPIRGMVVMDVNNDGNLDVLGAGNHYYAEVETMRYDAGTGVCLLGDGQGGFTYETVVNSGFFANKDARDVAVIKGEKPVIVVTNNSDKLQFFEMK